MAKLLVISLAIGVYDREPTPCPHPGSDDPSAAAYLTAIGDTVEPEPP
jgi:hypothetical protein